MRTFLFLLVALPALAFARPPDGGPPDGEERGEAGERPERKGHRGPPPHVVLLDNADAIGLDDAATARVQALADAARPTLDALHEGLRALHPGDEGFSEARAELMDAEKALMDDIRAELTDAQWAAAREILPPPPGHGPPPGERGGADDEGECPATRTR